MPCGCMMVQKKNVKRKNSRKNKRIDGVKRLLNMLRKVQLKTPRKGRV